MNLADRLPRILLVEDDPVSANFLRAALEGLPAQVDYADTLAAARIAATNQRHALWCIDANLPDGRGIDLLHALRAAGQDATALAHTADADPAVAAMLSDGGFAGVLTKPLSVEALHAAIRNALSANAGETDAFVRIAAAPGAGAEDIAASPLWDDAAALRALNGNQAILGAMRGLYRKDLETMQPQIAQAMAIGDRETILATLHKLKAGSGFVGAVRIAAAVRVWQEALDTDSAATAYRAFEDAVGETLATL
jgi:DNA-binding response OmpR family regulator